MEPQTPSGEGRALSAAMSAPAPFTSRAGALALHASDRHVDRWAPERDAVGRSRSLGTLSFVDRLISPWLTGASQATRGSGRGGSSSYEHTPWAQGVSWVFPRPWYQDELDWMAAAREGGEQSRSGLLTTQGTYARPDAMQRQRPPAAMATVGSGDQTVVAVADQLPRYSPMANYEYVAPSMSAAPSPGAARGGLDVRTPGAAAPIAHAALPMHRALRAWSPQVSFAAAQAAELMAGTVAIAEQAGLTTAARSPVLEGLAYVAPAELAASSQTAAHGGAAPISGQAAAHVARSIAQLAAVQAVSRTSTVESARAAVAETTAPARTAASLGPSAAEPSAPAASAPAVAEAYRAEQDRVIETMQAAPSAEASSTATSWPAAGPTAATYQDLVQVAAQSPAAAQAMRTVELVARSALSGSSEPTAGPRVALPAGLGGAMAGFAAAHTAAQPMMAQAAERTEPASTPIGGPRFGATERSMVSNELLSTIAPAASVTGRGFVPVWAAPDAGPAALSAVSSGRPAAMGHLAWADRWLARLSGASPASLSAFDIAAEHTIAVPRALSVGAPEMGYVIPSFLDEQASPTAAAAAIARPGRPGASPVAPTLRAPAATPPTTALRIDDNEATPDEVFAAIARAARPRKPPTAAEIAQSRAASAEPTAAAIAEAPRPAVERLTLADQIAQSAPSAPTAGLYAGLASSPMAPALAGILPLPSAPMFDPRALFASGLVSAYVGGALSPAGFAPAAAAAGMAATTMASWARLPGGMTVTEAGVSPMESILGVASRAPAPAWISPSLPGAAAAPAAEGRELVTSRATPGQAPVAAPAATRPTIMPGAIASAEVSDAPSSVAPRGLDPVWSLRAPVLAAPAPMAPTTGAGTVAGFSLDAPLVDVGTAGWTPRPGMIAERAQGFAVEHERSAADLSFDFVSPELLLAARVYGFGPAEAAQASRLAVAGPSGLAAMASTLDLTFLRQLHIAAEHAGATPGGDPGILAAPRRSTAAPAQRFDAGGQVAAPTATESVPLTAYPTSSLPPAPEMPLLQPSAPVPAQAPAGTVFGVERRLPRGSFLWPAGAVSALDLRANLPDGNAALPVAALELLAASAVAEMGSLVSPATAEAVDDGDDAVATSTSPTSRRGASMRGVSALGSLVAPWIGTTDAPSQPGGAPPSGALSPSGFVAPAVDQVADAVAVPAAHRARFETVYLALSQSPQGQSLSPSVRAARALSIAARQDGAGEPSTPHDRALAAWSVMPVVFSSPGSAAESSSLDDGESFGGELPYAAARPGRAAGAPPMSMLAATVSPELRPGLQGLSGRAGEAIGAFVHPSGPEVARASSGAVRSAGADVDVERPGNEIVRELVRGGGGGGARPFSRTGGGEVEIPSWFESAARRMIESRGVSDNLSIADLTLIASTPSQQIAASTRGSSPSSSAPAAAAGAGSAEHGEKPDVDKIAAEVYGEIIRMLEVARERSGDPWQ